MGNFLKSCVWSALQQHFGVYFPWEISLYVYVPLSLNNPVVLLISLELCRLMFHYRLRYGCCYSPIIAFSLSISLLCTAIADLPHLWGKKNAGRWCSYDEKLLESKPTCFKEWVNMHIWQQIKISPALKCSEVWAARTKRQNSIARVVVEAWGSTGMPDHHKAPVPMPLH